MRRWSVNDYMLFALEQSLGEVPEPVGVRNNALAYDDDGKGVLT